MTDGTSDTTPPPEDQEVTATTPVGSVHAEPSRVVWAGLARPFAVGFFVTLGGLVAILLGLTLSNLSTVIIYVVLALFVALGLDPVVRFLGRRGLSRAWSIVVVFVGFALVLAGVLGLIIPMVVRQVAQFVNDLPTFFRDFMATDLYAWLQDTFGDSVNDLVGQVQTFVTDPAHIAAIGGGVLQVGVGIASVVSGIVIVVVLSLYFIASMPAIKTSLIRLAPARNRSRVMGMTEQITDSIGGYLMGMVLLAFFNSVFTLILYLILGLPFPLLLAVVAFAITLIPLIGPVLFWVIGSVFALITAPLPALIFAIAYLIYIQVEAYVLTPRVMSRTISVPGSLVVIGALVGGTLLGLLGALVAIPVAASILLIVKQVIVPRQDAKL